METAPATPPPVPQETPEPWHLWQRLQVELQALVKREQFETWFRRAALRGVAGQTVSIAVQNTFARDWLVKNYREQLEQVVRTVFGEAFRFEFVVDPELTVATQPRPARANGSAEPAALAPRPTRLPGRRPRPHRPGPPRAETAARPVPRANPPWRSSSCGLPTWSSTRSTASTTSSSAPATASRTPRPWASRSSRARPTTRSSCTAASAWARRTCCSRCASRCSTACPTRASCTSPARPSSTTSSARSRTATCTSSATSTATWTSWWSTTSTCWPTRTARRRSSSTPSTRSTTPASRSCSRRTARPRRSRRCRSGWCRASSGAWSPRSSRPATRRAWRSSSARAASAARELPDDVAQLLAEHIDNNIRELEGAVTQLIGFADALGAGRSRPSSRARSCATSSTTSAAASRRWTTSSSVVTEHFGVKLTDLQSRRRTNAIAYPRQVGHVPGAQDHAPLPGGDRRLLRRPRPLDRALRDREDRAPAARGRALPRAHRPSCWTRSSRPSRRAAAASAMLRAPPWRTRHLATSRVDRLRIPRPLVRARSRASLVDGRGEDRLDCTGSPPCRAVRQQHSRGDVTGFASGYLQESGRARYPHPGRPLKKMKKRNPSRKPAQRSMRSVVARRSPRLPTLRHPNRLTEDPL